MTTDYSAARLRNHFERLCKDYGVGLCTTCKTKFAHNVSMVDVLHNVDHRLCVAPINGPISYITAMHELGHTQHPQGAIHHQGQSRYKSLLSSVSAPTSQLDHLSTWDLNLLIVSELSAWEWALRHALTWTPTMARAYRYAIATYLRGFVILKNELPIVDALDEKFQTCSPREAIKILVSTMLEKLEMVVDNLGKAA